MQLSLYDNNQNQSEDHGGTQGQALQVLSAEGEELPWVIVLQPEDTNTEEEVERSSDVSLGDILDHQSEDKILDLHALVEMLPPSRHGDPMAVIKEKMNKTVEKTWKRLEMEAENGVGMLALREQVGEEKPREGNTEEEDEDEEEELDNTGEGSCLSGSQQPGDKLKFEGESSGSQQNINPKEEMLEVLDNMRKSKKRKDANKASVTKGNSNLISGTSAESGTSGQKVTRKDRRTQRQTTRSDVRPIRSQKRDDGTERRAADTPDTFTPPFKAVEKKRTADMEGERGEVKANEEEGERGDAPRQKEETVGSRRRIKKLKHKELVVGETKGTPQEEETDSDQEEGEDSLLRPSKTPSASPGCNSYNSEDDVDVDVDVDTHDRSGSRSLSPTGSTAAVPPLGSGRPRMSTVSSCGGTATPIRMGPASSRGRLSSCSTIMSSRSRRSQEKEEEEAAALLKAKRAERRRQEVERKRREQEEEERKKGEREQTEGRMRGELEEERRRRAEELRMKRMAKEEERRKEEEEEQERARRQQVQKDRERRRQEERKRQMEGLQRMREEEEGRRKAELDRLRLEEERRREEECKKLQEMDESERIEYLRKKEEEEEERRNKEEERRRMEEEAAEEARLQEALLAREVGLLQQQLAFKQGLMMEAGGLEKTQGISRPWTYSYFTLLQLLGLNPAKNETLTP
ncbi:uncharacterized protein KIAA2012 homolog isoform X2 [Antennarius striatus]|uniref:uncharacterized protein KIAA2012 homolog isoform X2 n=1 Tax=Antennarius striatus TaxID=241820 RepID=UPI0035B14C5E